MTEVFHWTLEDQATYKAQRWEMITDVEGFHNGTLYYDSNGYLSNGTGFNLTDTFVRNAVIKGLGLDPELHADDQRFIDQIKAELTPDVTKKTPNADASGIQGELDRIMADRKAHYAGLSPPMNNRGQKNISSNKGVSVVTPFGPLSPHQEILL